MNIPYVKLATAGVISTILLGSGCAGGYLIRSQISTMSKRACAEDIKRNSTAACPVEVVDAFKSLGIGAAQVEVEQAQAAIPIIVQGSDTLRIIERVQAADVAALSNQERTNACSASPAVELRRRQLQRDTSPVDPAEPSPAGLSGGAVRVPEREPALD